MKALRYSEDKGVRLEEVPLPIIANGNEVLIKVLRAGICSTDLEITRGYVPGYDATLGHEFVGQVAVDFPSNDRLIAGCRVVAEINCPCEPCSHPDPFFVRNHTPKRTVLGIIGRDGTMAEYCSLPPANLHIVPDDVTDQEACFAEPLAAACRIVEQNVITPSDAVAVIGDGKLGLLIAHVLAMRGFNPTFLGRHQRKLDLVEGVERIIVTDTTATELAAKFDVVVEASGSPQGITLALALTRPLGTLILKSTCSTVGKGGAGGDIKGGGDGAAETGMGNPQWSEIANDVVVNEKKVIGSRCGPFPPALELLRDERTKKLVNAMVDAVLPLEEGEAGIKKAATKGALKVQLVMGGQA